MGAVLVLSTEIFFRLLQQPVKENLTQNPAKYHLFSRLHNVICALFILLSQLKNLLLTTNEFRRGGFPLVRVMLSTVKRAAWDIAFGIGNLGGILTTNQPFINRQ